MAAIDKIYGTTDQARELRSWLEQHYPEALGRLYPVDGYDDADRPISNFLQEQDKWLLENCPLSWVVDRIKEQYGL